MKTFTSYFQAVSYLQYPLIFAALGYLIYPLFALSLLSDPNGFQLFMEKATYYWNISLLMFGLGVSFSTLQDTTKTQNELSKKVWQDARKGKSALLMMATIIIMFVGFGLAGILIWPDTLLGALAYGMLALGIAYVGVLRSAMEMFTYQQEIVTKNT